MFVTFMFIVFSLNRSAREHLYNIFTLELHFSWPNNDNEIPEKDI